MGYPERISRFDPFFEPVLTTTPDVVVPTDESLYTLVSSVICSTPSFIQEKHNSCLEVVTTPQSFATAKVQCSKLGGHLLTIGATNGRSTNAEFVHAVSLLKGASIGTFLQLRSVSRWQLCGVAGLTIVTTCAVCSCRCVCRLDWCESRDGIVVVAVGRWND